jgi:hypothetical protein
LGCGADYACWRHAARRNSRNRGTDSNPRDGSAARKPGNAAGDSGDAAGKFSDSDHAANDDPGAWLKFAEDANPG